MNKSMLIGVAAGVAIATAGGVVAGYQLFGKAPEPGSLASTGIEADEATGSALVVEHEPVTPARPAVQATPAPQPARATQAAVTPAPAPAAVQEECWDEEVVVQADRVDEHAIAGTAIGAVVGGAVARDVGDRDLTTAVGAAAGAVIGRRIQRRIQDNREEQRTVTTIERRCAPVGSR
jgi:uncharacterized protein YcfJ